jgi:DNA modification methylase
MAPSIVWNSLPDNGKFLRVLDPMAGSGTSLVIARARGHQAIGCDTDPLAVLIARAWCSEVDSDRLVQRAKLVLEEAIKHAKELSPDEAYPSGADKETKQVISFWFDENNRIQLTALSNFISHVDDANDKNLLWVAFSRLIITKKLGVSLAMDVSHSRPHRKYEQAPIKPFDKFLDSVEQIIKKAPFHDGNAQDLPAIVTKGDARHLSLSDHSIDLVITSPPYLNAIDYIRGHKLSSVWMGHSAKTLRTVRATNVGAEISISSAPADKLLDIFEQMGNVDRLEGRYRSMIVRYLIDMSAVLTECRRVLKDNGEAIFVIGNSAIRGVFINNSEALISLAQRNGFKLASRASRTLPESRRYLPPPNLKTAGERMRNRMREEVILHFVAV